MKDPIRILILDNDKGYREKVAHYLDQESRLQVVELGKYL